MTVSVTRLSTLLLALGAAWTGICAAQVVPSSSSGRFELLDANGDGVVREDEYSSDALFAAIDSNRNSRISVTELQAILGPQGDGELSASDRLRIADRNGDGELEHEELRRSAEMRFQQLDVNRDEQVDMGEFRARFGRP